MPAVLTVQPKQKDLGGGFLVRRLLPAAARRAVGPFIFFDHFGPVIEHPDDNFDVRPHPHIGLATVTYLFEGAMMHRDSLGYTQRIEPGAINWMTAGSGIAHSERRPDDLANTDYRIHGLQLWAGLPSAQEECAPSFSHTPASALPVFKGAGFSARILIGSAFGLQSPVATFSETLYIDVAATAGATIELPSCAAELALYSIDNALDLDGDHAEPLQLSVLDATRTTVVKAAQGARFVVVGGAPLDGYRHMWWNFVSSRKERIEQAKADWQAQRFARVPGDYIPLPEH